MAEFKVRPQVIRNESNDLNNISRRLRNICNDISSASKGLSSQDSSFENLRHNINGLSEKLDISSVNTMNLAAALRQAADLYIRTENQLANTGNIKASVATVLLAVQKIIRDAISRIGRIISGLKTSTSAFDGDPVDMTSGFYLDEITELAINGPCDLNFTRYYNSGLICCGTLGVGWSHNYEISLDISEELIIIHRGDQSQEAFTEINDGVFTSKAGSYDILTRTDDGYLYKTGINDIWLFDNGGRLISMTRGSGCGSITFEYNGALLAAAKDSYGNSLVYDYSGDGLLISVKDSAGRSVQFDYMYKCLTGITSADGFVRAYEYDDKGHLTSVRSNSDDVIIHNEYDSEGRVIRQQLADGSSAELTYKEDSVIFRDRNGAVTTYIHDDLGRISEIIYPAGTERYEYNDCNERILYVDPEGNHFRRKYDENGNITEYTDPLGNVSRFTYNDNGSLIRSEVPGCGTSTSSYDENGNVITSTDSLGNITKYTYENGLLTSVLNPDGGRSEFTYNDKGLLSEVCDESGSVEKYEYDAAGRLIEYMDAVGAVTRYQYDEADRITGVTDALGHKRSYEYRGGLLTLLRDFDGEYESWEYDSMGQTISYTDKGGRVTSYRYDDMSNLSEIHNPDGSVLVRRYDDMNRLCEVTGPEGAHLLAEYDANGNCVRKSENGHITTYTYDRAGRLSSVTGSDGNVCSYEYDAAGRPVRIKHKDGREYVYRYDTNGNQTASAEKGGRKYNYQYDSMNRLIFSTDHESEVVRYSYYPDGLIRDYRRNDGIQNFNTYDRTGRISKVTQANGYELSYSYDKLGRLLSIEDNERRCRTRKYDEAGNITEVTDPLGHTTRYSYSATGCLTRVTDALGNMTAFAYDDMDRQVMMLRGNHTEEEIADIFAFPEKYQTPDNESVRLTRWVRDTSGSIIERIDAHGNRQCWSYNEDGQLRTSVDAYGRETRYDYDAHLALAKVTYPDGRSASYARDGISRITGVRDWTGELHFAYDMNSKLISSKDSAGNIVRYSNDAAGRPSGITYPDGMTVSYTYNSRGFVSGLSTPGFEAEYVYGEDGRASARKVSVECTGRPDRRIFTEHYKYDLPGKLKSLTQMEADIVINDLSFEYDDAGNMIGREAENDAGRKKFIYKYDALNRIRKVIREGEGIAEEYEYDEYGNCVRSFRDGITTEFSFNVLDQLTRKCVHGEGPDRITTYTYDKEGRLTGTEGYENSARTYDSLGHLESVTCRNGKLIIETNAMGHVISETGSTGKKMFCLDLSDGDARIAGVNDGSGWQHVISDGRIAGIISPGMASAVMCDEKGSVLRTLGASDDWSDPSLMRQYDAYGAVVNDDNAEKGLMFGFAGLYNNNDIGTLATASREYDPVSGRFLSRDDDRYLRSQRPETFNLYQYCFSNPLIWVDPDGTDCYIFYLPEWKNEAVNDQRQLAKQYGYDESKVHLVPVTNNNDFRNGWNNMGTENGSKVDIDTVVVNTHGNPYVLGGGKKHDMVMGSNDIRNLDNKTMDNLILLGCNSGHKDYADTNPAAEFARKVDGAPVMASDGTVQSNLTFFNQTKRSYSSKGDKHYRGYRPDGSKRKNSGWVVYQERDGRVTTSDVNDKKMNVTDMVKELNKHPKSNARCPRTGGGSSGGGGASW